MEKRLETVSVMRGILRDASKELWCIEPDPGNMERLVRLLKETIRQKRA